MSSRLRIMPGGARVTYRPSRGSAWATAMLAVGLAAVAMLLLFATRDVRGAVKSLNSEKVANSELQGAQDKPAVADNIPQSPRPVEPVQAISSLGVLKAGANVQLVNAISVELTGIKRDGESVLADICFQLPSSADWQLASYPDDVILAANGQSFVIAASHLIDWQTSAVGVKTIRCDELNFYVPASVDLSAATLTVKRLITSTSEAMDCSSFQNKLASARTGIVIKCDVTDYGMTINIVQKPAALSDSAANRLVDDSGKDIVLGPWEFETSAQ